LSRYFFRLVCEWPTRPRSRSSTPQSNNRIGIERHLPESATRASSKTRCFSRWRRKQCRPASAGAATRSSRRCWCFSSRLTARLGAFCRRPALSTGNASFRSYGCRSQCRVRRTITSRWRSASPIILTRKARHRPTNPFERASPAASRQSRRLSSSLQLLDVESVNVCVHLWLNLRAR
jgi:hypothetical protein